MWHNLCKNQTKNWSIDDVIFVKRFFNWRNEFFSKISTIRSDHKLKIKLFCDYEDNAVLFASGTFEHENCMPSSSRLFPSDNTLKCCVAILQNEFSRKMTFFHQGRAPKIVAFYYGTPREYFDCFRKSETFTHDEIVCTLCPFLSSLSLWHTSLSI